MHDYAFELADYTREFYEKFPFLQRTQLYYQNPASNQTIIELHTVAWELIKQVKAKSVLDIGSGAGFIRLGKPQDVELDLSDTKEENEIDFFTHVRERFNFNLSVFNKRFLVHRTREWLGAHKQYDAITALRFLPWDNNRVNFTLQELVWFFEEVRLFMTSQGTLFYCPIDTYKVESTLNHLGVDIRPTSGIFIITSQQIDYIIKKTNEPIF